MSQTFSELSSNTQELKPEENRELGNFLPEFIANSPLEGTSLVFSIPFKGEWKNGNLTRLLKAMFSQHVKKGDSFELEMIANIGDNLTKLIVLDEKTHEPKRYEQGRFFLEENPKNENQQQALELLKENNEATDYLKKIIEVQRLARILLASKNQAVEEKLRELIEGIADPIQKDIALSAVEKADSISLTLVDVTHTFFRGSNLIYYPMLESMRTLGLDIIKSRFKINPNIAVSMFDVDSIPENNNIIFDLQTIYNEHPNLNYVFSHMSNLPAGYSRDFSGDAPRENISRTTFYNRGTRHGSPQISFRLKAYDKLKEIAGWSLNGFTGEDDFDTAYRLIYHLGKLQDGLLLEGSADLYYPTFLTADRLDGFSDSANRKLRYENNGVQHLTKGLDSLFSFKEEMKELIASQTLEKQQEIKEFIEKSRVYFLRKQGLQSKFNRVILNTFLEAVNKNFIKIVNEKLEIETSKVMTLRAGTALAHYLNSNRNLVKEALSSSDDLQVIKYYLGLTKDLPQQELTPFQLAIREYVGNVQSIDDFINTGSVTVTKVKGRDFDKWLVVDSRSKNSKDSIMHSAIAEVLALANTYKMYFETKDFFNSRDDFNGFGQWPINPDEQDLPMSYGNQEERIHKIDANLNTQGLVIEKKEEIKKNWLPNIEFRSIPMFKLFKKLAS